MNDVAMWMILITEIAIGLSAYLLTIGLIIAFMISDDEVRGDRLATIAIVWLAVAVLHFVRVF